MVSEKQERGRSKHYTKDIPVVVMTAYSYLYPRVKNGDRVDGYFQKPFDIDEMLSTIEKILEV